MNVACIIRTNLLTASVVWILSVMGIPHAEAAQGILCGRAVSFDLTKSPDEIGFVGVWVGGRWNANICGALIVQRAVGGSADVIYIYGPSSARGLIRWTSLRRTARVDGNELTFRDDQGGTFLFRRAGSTLMARFIDARGRSLQTMLQKNDLGEIGPRSAYAGGPVRSIRFLITNANDPFWGIHLTLTGTYKQQGKALALNLEGGSLTKGGGRLASLPIDYVRIMLCSEPHPRWDAFPARNDHKTQILRNNYIDSFHSVRVEAQKVTIDLSGIPDVGSKHLCAEIGTFPGNWIYARSADRIEWDTRATAAEAAVSAPEPIHPGEIEERKTSVIDDAADTLIASARKEKKPSLIKSYLLKNVSSPAFSTLMQAYVELSGHAKSHPFGVIETLKIYDTPNIQGRVLREDAIGKTYVVVRKEGDFTYVEYDLDKYGYIYHGFLD